MNRVYIMGDAIGAAGVGRKAMYVEGAGMTEAKGGDPLVLGLFVGVAGCTAYAIIGGALGATFDDLESTMSDTMLELGRRAVACKGWRWMPGMRTVRGVRLSCGFDTYPGGIMDGDGRVRPKSEVVQHDGLPDFTDAATLGCLLALVRDAWGDPGVSAWRSDRAEPAVWEVDASGGVSLRGPALYRTEAEALVAALEAAP